MGVVMNKATSKIQKITFLLALVVSAVNTVNIYAASLDQFQDITRIEKKSTEKMLAYEKEARSYAESKYEVSKYAVSKKIKQYKNEAKKIAKDSEVMAEGHKKEVSGIKIKSLKAANDYVRQNKDIFGIEQNSCGEGGMEEEVRSKGKRLVFLTLAMNKKNLEQIIREARVYGFIPVIRGFKDGSYIATAKYLSDIIEKTGYGVEVDPESFKEFDVKLVPTFVVAAPKCTEGNCKGVKYNKVTGNISFDHVLRLFATRGDILEDDKK